MYQIKKIFSALSVIMMLVLIGGCASKTAKVEQFTGYLGDYSKLKKTKDVLGNEVLRWKSPKLDSQSYTKIILDNIVFYPKPKTTPQISKDVLIQIRGYANEALKREVSKVLPLTNQPGPGVLRIRAALTGVATAAEGLKAYEYIPIAAIAAGITTAAGGRDREAFIIIEFELLDSRTGKRLAMSVSKRKAEKLLKDDKQQLSLEHMRKVIDDGADQTRMLFERHTK